MRRTTAVTAAIVAASSIALIAPAAQASTPNHRHLTGIVSCDEGQAKLVTRVSKHGREHGKVTVTGLISKVWHGGLLLNPAAAFAAAESADSVASDPFFKAFHKTYDAKHGSFHAAASQRGARTLDAMAQFSAGPKMCNVALGSDGENFMVGGVMDSLGVRSGDASHAPTVIAEVSGEAYHRYRVEFSVRTSAGAQHRTVVRTAGVLGVIEPSVGFKGLGSFTDAKATVTDLDLGRVIDRFELER